MNIKKFGIVLIGLMFSSFSAMTVAAPNSKANQKAHDKVKEKAKVSIAHCGCNSDGDGLEWKKLNVSVNAKGHRNHVEGHSTLCTGVDDEGNDVVTTFYRGVDDCELGLDEGEVGLLLDACQDDMVDLIENDESCELVEEEEPEPVTP